MTGPSRAAIRPAAPGDIDELVAIEAAVFDTDRLSRAAFRRLIAPGSHAVLVAADPDGRVQGYAALLWRAGDRDARLYSLAVTPEARGRGHAKALLAAVEREARSQGASGLRLEVKPANTAAVGLYREAGFEPFGRIERYYEDGSDAMRLGKRLNETES